LVLFIIAMAGHLYLGIRAIIKGDAEYFKQFNK
jgi:hypothetical protein